METARTIVRDAGVNAFAYSFLVLALMWALGLTYQPDGVKTLTFVSANYEGPSWAFAKHWDPCPSDEGEGPRCVWHARRHGNGLGQSFIRTGAGRVVVIRHHDATILLRPLYGESAS